MPSFRPDVEREVDVIEEVARHLGYDHIAPTRKRSPGVGLLTAHQADRRRLAGLVAGYGADEAWTSSIVDPGHERRLGTGAAPVGLVNPIVREESALRTSLLPGLLGCLRHNASVRNPAVRLFEIGHVFAHPGQGVTLPAEREQLGVVLGFDGDGAPEAVRLWEGIAEGLGLLDAGLGLVQDQPGSRAVLADDDALGCHPTRTAAVAGADASGAVGTVGFVGEVDPAALEAYNLAGRRVGWLVLDTVRLFASVAGKVQGRCSVGSPRATSICRSPSTPRCRRRAGSVVRAAAGEYCEDVRLVDVFRGPGLGSGTRSLTFRLRFVAPDRTLTDADVAVARARCIAAAEAELGAGLRG